MMHTASWETCTWQTLTRRPIHLFVNIGIGISRQGAPKKPTTKSKKNKKATATTTTTTATKSWSLGMSQIFENSFVKLLCPPKKPKIFPPNFVLNTALREDQHLTLEWTKTEVLGIVSNTIPQVCLSLTIPI